MIFVDNHDFVPAAKNIVRFVGSRAAIAMWYETNALYMVSIFPGNPMIYAQIILAAESVNEEREFSKSWSAAELKEFVDTLKPYGTTTFEQNVDEDAFTTCVRYRKFVTGLGAAQAHIIPASGMRVPSEGFARALAAFKKEPCTMEYFSYSLCKHVYRFRNTQGLVVYVAGMENE